MKSSILIILIFCIVTTSLQLNLICEFNIQEDWWILKNVYQCNVKTSLNIITSEKSNINSIKGNHLANHTDKDVKVFRIQNHNAHFFPTQLEAFFRSLAIIDIRHSHLKEIHQAHIKPFPKLRGIVLYDNDIEILENGIFDYNLNLEMVWMNQNKLVHIDLNVFDNLSKLTYLSFESNVCISMNIKNNSKEVKEIIEKSKEKCQVRTIKTLIEANKNLTKKSIDLESISKSLSHQTNDSENVRNSLSFMIQKIDKISGECDSWKYIRFGFFTVAGVVYNLIILVILIYFYRACN